MKLLQLFKPVCVSLVLGLTSISSLAQEVTYLLEGEVFINNTKTCYPETDLTFGVMVAMKITFDDEAVGVITGGKDGQFQNMRYSNAINSIEIMVDGKESVLIDKDQISGGTNNVHIRDGIVGFRDVISFSMHVPNKVTIPFDLASIAIVNINLNYFDRATLVDTTIPYPIPEPASSPAFYSNIILRNCGFNTVNLRFTSLTFVPVTTEALVENLATTVLELNIANNISNALDAKLDNVLKATDDKNDVSAVNSIDAFINSVKAQRGKKLTDEQADKLIAAAQGVIDSLE